MVDNVNLSAQFDSLSPSPLSTAKPIIGDRTMPLHRLLLLHRAKRLEQQEHLQLDVEQYYSSQGQPMDDNSLHLDSSDQEVMKAVRSQLQLSDDVDDSSQKTTSSSWWIRLSECGLGNAGINDDDDDNGTCELPETRRSHSSTIYQIRERDLAAVFDDSDIVNADLDSDLGAKQDTGSDIAATLAAAVVGGTTDHVHLNIEAKIHSRPPAIHNSLDKKKAPAGDGSRYVATRDKEATEAELSTALPVKLGSIVRKYGGCSSLQSSSIEPNLDGQSAYMIDTIKPMSQCRDGGSAHVLTDTQKSAEPTEQITTDRSTSATSGGDDEAVDALNLTSITDPDENRHLLASDGEKTGPTTEQLTSQTHPVPLQRSTPKSLKDGGGIKQEYMIISGGFADDDWSTFPVWAFDMTSSIDDQAGSWTMLTPTLSGSLDCGNKKVLDDNGIGIGFTSSFANLWDNAMACNPTSRIGHISHVHDGYLYVFGGLMYDQLNRVFAMEDFPYMYRLPIDDKLLPSRNPERKGSSANVALQMGGWQRIVPRVQTPDPSMMKTMANSKHHVQASNALDIVNRGEVRGGFWKAANKLVIYGGLHVHNVESFHRLQQMDTPLGDVWAYDFTSDSWEMLSPSHPAMTTSTGNDGDADVINDHPVERTSHAATVVGDELIIYGGLSYVQTNTWDGSTLWDELDDVWVFNLKERVWKERPMSPSLARSYHSLVGWESPTGDGSIVASFGGYRTEKDSVRNEPRGFVFDDLLISHPSLPDYPGPTSWLKATYPSKRTAMISNRLEHSAVLSDVSGEMFVWGGRFEFTWQIAGMWGINLVGSDNRVNYVKADPDNLSAYREPVTMLYVAFTAMMLLSMIVTYMCGMLARQNESGDIAQSLETQSMPGVSQVNSNVFGRRSGLRQDIIDSLPLKIFVSPTLEHQESSAAVNGSDEAQNDYCETDIIGVPPGHQVSLSVNTQVEMEFPKSIATSSDCEEPCCPICLVEYSNGDSVRSLPCKHEFHKACIDTWLVNHASCPACRQSLRDLRVPSQLPLSSTLTFPQTNLTWDLLFGSTLSVRGEESVDDTPPDSSPSVVIAPTWSFSQLVQNMLLSRRSNLDETNFDIHSENVRSPSETVREYGSSDFENTELDLHYASSLELTEEIGTSGQEVLFGQREGGTLEEVNNTLPMYGRSRQIRIERARGRGRMRRRGRMEESNLTPLNDPLHSLDESVLV